MLMRLNSVVQCFIEAAIKYAVGFSYYMADTLKHSVTIMRSSFQTTFLFVLSGSESEEQLFCNGEQLGLVYSSTRPVEISTCI